MEKVKKIGCLITLMLILVGAITSLVLCGKAGQWVAFVGTLAVAVAAIPTIVKLFNYLKS